MDVLLSLNSSSGLINISKLHKHHHNLHLSNNHQRQRQPRRLQFSVSCRATKSVPMNHKLKDEDGNLYKTLSLSPKTATTDEIKRAYRTMALRYHPDVCRDGLKKEESTRMFVKLNEAYKILSNPKLKEEYDSKLLGLGDMRSSVNSCQLFLWDDEIRDDVNMHRMKLPECKSCDILSVKLETATNKIEKLKKKNASQNSVNMRLKKTILILCLLLIGIVYYLD
ncbi:uncharacterized protein LOC131598714 [Vicia villosa]|uniref:uncharacterized protein LOC131598714 n=1 Tax=Vicia villosa TaxID=3911 RepID=UPI00273BE15F|nr:uncharacterized protein LOC131598714 [Vicia villosa]